MKNVKYYYRLDFNLSRKNPAKVKLSAGKTEKQKGQQNPLQWRGDVSNCGRTVQRRRKSLPWPAEKTSYRHVLTEGTILLLRRGWPNTEAWKGKIWELKCELALLSRESTSSIQSMAGLPWVAFVPFLHAPWISPGSFCCLWGENCGYPNLFCPRVYATRGWTATPKLLLLLRYFCLMLINFSTAQK